MNIVRRSFLALFWKQIRTYVSKPTNHYDSLGISSNSTQSEIKNAYYKLSMVYHPDKNQGNAEYAQKFRAISEAYEILGNVKSRKLYDKGFNFPYTATTKVDPSMDRFYRSQDTRSRTSPLHGKTPIYDFDEWSKNHYGKVFRQKQENRRRATDYRQFMENETSKVKFDRMIYVMALLVFISMFVMRKDYDINTVVKRHEPAKDS